MLHRGDRSILDNMVSIVEHQGAMGGSGAGVGTVAQVVSLAAVAAGKTGVVRAVELGADDAKLLCAMGLCVGAKIKMVRRGEPCVVAVGGVNHQRCKCGGRCRIGVARALAACVLVEPD